MSDRPPPRRPEFDEIANGWGSDGLPDLMARVELLLEYWKANFPLSPAELKVARAITKRASDLGGMDVPVLQ